MKNNKDTKHRKMALHVGYQLTLTTEQLLGVLKQVAQRAPQICKTIPVSSLDDFKIANHSDFLMKPIVAIHFRAGNKEMKDWYDAQKSVSDVRPFIAYFRGYYYTLKKKRDEVQLLNLVLHVTINGSHQWITLIRGNDISAITLKKWISYGALGAEIEVDSQPLPCVPYIV